MYQKEIIYMGLHKDGSRLGSAGFLKVECRDRESSLYLKIKNIPHSINGRFPVRFYNGADWKEVDGITLQEGGGLWEECEPQSLKQVRLQIVLPSGYLIEGISKEAQQQASDRQEKVDAEERKRTSITEENMLQDRANEDRNMENQRSESADTSVSDIENTKIANKDTGETAIENRNTGERDINQTETVERIPVQKQRRSVPEAILEAPVMVSEELPPPMADDMQMNGLKEDKWEQILSTYDQIHPYGDERVYVKLEPKDFVILQAQYQQLVNNSFLLHGFYNYRYVILGKENDYYLGVQGVFYEREKMVALMFGFEAFECQGGEAKPGEFGYYLRRVEL